MRTYLKKLTNNVNAMLQWMPHVYKTMGRTKGTWWVIKGSNELGYGVGSENDQNTKRFCFVLENSKWLGLMELTGRASA